MEGLGQPQVAGPGPHQGVRAALSCPSRLCRGQRGHATGLKCWLPPGTDWSCTGSLNGARVGSALGGRVVHSQRGRSDSCFPLGPLKSVPGGREGSGQRARSSGFGQRATGASEILEQGPELPFPAPLDRRGACCRAGSAEPHLSSSVRGEAVHPALLRRPGSHNIRASLVLDPTTGPQLGACCMFALSATCFCGLDGRSPG